ncbi:MAG: NAD-dependent deacylase [Candidatus Latescibacterota bacterium]
MALSQADREKIGDVVSILRQSESILFITGAGISADSGLPTYRGIGGLYNRERTEEGYRIEDALSGGMMRGRPEITWKYILQIERACRGARFNRAHEVIAAFEKEFPRVWTLTQNIDGFHRDAGSKNLIDIHGDIHDIVCTNCEYRETVQDYREVENAPLCPQCGKILRPDVVLFGERLPYDKMAVLQRELDKGFDIVFSLGTTSVFPYIAEPALLAKHRGNVTVEINPGYSEITDIFDFKFFSGAAETLEEIWSQLEVNR